MNTLGSFFLQACLRRKGKRLSRTEYWTMTSQIRHTESDPQKGLAPK